MYRPDSGVFVYFLWFTSSKPYQNMDESLPYRIAYSTGVEQCKKCRLQIDDASIQIAIMAQVTIVN